MNGDKHLPSGGREFERGFGWTLLLSAAAHVAILAALVVVPGFVLRPQPQLVSYTTVDLVDPKKLGGTNLVEGAKGKAAAPPKVEPAKAKAEPPPPPPPEAAKPEPPPEPQKAELKEEPRPKEEAKPVPPKPPEAPQEDAVALEKKVEPTPTTVQVAKIAPTVAVVPPTLGPKAEPTRPKPTVAAAQATATAPPKAVAEVKTTATPARAAKAQGTPTKGQPQAVAKAPASPAKPNTTPGKGLTPGAAKTTPAAGSGKARDDQIAAAIKRIEEQAGTRGGGSGTAPGDQPGGPISIGPGEGVGGEVRGIAFIMYTNRLEAMIKEKWVWAGSDKTLKADIGFNILPSGEVLNVRTVVSSGDANYDRRAETAVRAASPFPSPPEEYQSEFETVGFVYTFEPN